mgnify:FL=1
MASIPKMLVITPILQISKIPVLICHTIICSLTLLCLCGNVPHKTVGELPEHGHAATCSTNGEHVHTAPTYNGSGGAPNGRISEVDRVNRASTVTVDKAGSHSHTISVSDTGKNLSHNNMSPYLSVYIWKRTV